MPTPKKSYRKLVEWDKSPRKCLECLCEYFPVNKEQMFCSKGCRNLQYAVPAWSEKGVSPGTVGAMNEMFVAYDLMRRGYDVFRALSPNGTCDLILISDQFGVVRVEVKSGNRNARTGTLYSSVRERFKTDRFDVLAIVAGSEIIYFPEVGDFLKRKT